MSRDVHDPELHEYPGGLLENPGHGVPLFLKLTYVGFTLFALIYFVRYLSGDGSALVQLFNQLTSHAGP